MDVDPPPSPSHGQHPAQDFIASDNDALDLGPLPPNPQVIRRIPAEHHDILPEPPARRPRVVLLLRHTVKTVANFFGIYREFWDGSPSYDPIHSTTTDDLTNSKSQLSTSDVTAESSHTSEIPQFYSSRSAEILMQWKNNGNTTKSDAELDNLVNNHLRHPDFSLDELKSPFRTQTENAKADAALRAAAKATNNSEKVQAFLNTTFRQSPVTIEVPSGSKDLPAWNFQVPGLYYRPLLALVQDMLTGPLGTKMHFVPYRLFQEQSDQSTEASSSSSTANIPAAAAPRSPPIRIRQDIIDSDAFMEEHKIVNRLKHKPIDKDPDCKLERVVAALMFWSDATQLANFGTAKLWPIYLMLANLTKYDRSRPSSGACEHLAYIPSVRDLILGLV